MTAADPNDAYSARLDSQWEELIKEEAALAEKRLKLQTATDHWSEHLRAMGRPVPVWGIKAKAISVQQDQEYDPFTRTVKIAKPRMGEMRKAVLLTIARATRANTALTSKEVIEQSGQNFGLVMNVLTQDRKRGLLKSTDGAITTRTGRGHHYLMTEKGFELLAQIGLDKEI